MSSTCLILRLSLIVVLTCGNAFAQDNVQPQITVVHPGIEALTEDLMSLTGLTSPTEQEDGEELRFALEDFSIGVDIARQIRVDIVTGAGPVNYLVWIPYKIPDDFLENVESLLGFYVLDQPGQPNLYLLDDEVDQGWLLMLPPQEFAVIALTTQATKDTTKQQVLQAGIPAPAFVRLKELRASFLATLSNSDSSEDSQAKRRETFMELRTEDMAVIQKRPTESTSEFELRKETSSIFYDELERVFVEAQSVGIWSNLNRDTAALSVAFDATALTLTSFAESIAEFGQAPDAFAEVQRLEDSVLSGRLNVPVDELRQKNATEYLDLLSTDIHHRIDGSETLQDSEKQATRTVIDDIITVFRDGFASGNVNGFVEATHDGTEFTLVGAVSAPGSDRLTDTLKQLPAARTGNTVELNFATAEEITIHKLTLAEGFVGLADRIFGVGREFFVGVGQDQVWLATGPGSADLLAAKVTEAVAGEPSDMALNVEMQLSPWVNRLRELAEEREMPDVVEDRAAWRDNLLMLKQLSESLATDDQLTLSVSSADGKLAGIAALNKGLLTFVGRQIAKLAKENLEL